MKQGISWPVLGLLLSLLVGTGCSKSAEVSSAKTSAAEPSVASSSLPGKAGSFAEEKIQVGSDERIYRLFVPDSVDLSQPAPLVFAFHGMGKDNKDHMAETSGLPELATAHKFILVFPAASAQLIQGQAIKAWALTPDHLPGDLAFFDALLAKLESQYRIDPNAVFVTGMSNGAYFTHVLGRARADKIAAIAAHSGELGQYELGLILSARKFPVMIIHGDADNVMPLELAKQARAVYEGAGHPVTYLEIPGWSHEWDNRVDEKIWDFFNTHRLTPPAPGP